MKVTLGEEVETACADLGLDAVDPESYRLWFCEAVQLVDGVAQSTLSDWDLILRLRSRSDVDDSTVKWRRQGRLQLSAGRNRRLGHGTDAKYEGDWSGDKQFESASLTRELPGGSVAALVESWPPLPGALLSASQTRFAARVTGRSRQLLRAAQPLGPVSALKWCGVPRLRVAHHGGDTKPGKEVYAERWRIGTLDFLELSIQVKASSALRWQERFTACLSDTIGRYGGAAATKTQLILDYLLGRPTPADQPDA